MRRKTARRSDIPLCAALSGQKRPIRRDPGSASFAAELLQPAESEIDSSEHAGSTLALLSAPCMRCAVALSLLLQSAAMSVKPDVKLPDLRYRANHSCAMRARSLRDV